MGEQTKNMLIGIFVLVACSLAVSFIMFLKPRVGDEKKVLLVRFSNINKVGIGTRVLFAGRPVGEVVSIEQIYDARSQPTDILGRVYFYQLTLRVDSSVQVYNTDEIAVQTSGLLGEKSIGIIPKAPPKGITPKLITNQPIYADSVDPLENALIELSELANDMETTFKEATNWLQTYGNDVGKSVQSFGSAMSEIQTLTAYINHSNLVDEVKKGVEYFSLTMDKMQQALTQMEKEGVFTNLGATLCNMKNATASINLVSKDLANGTGTLGKLIKNDDMYLRFTAILSKADTLMNDINNYGILFHLNKGWQRTHTQRANLLQALNTPSSFKKYFETEVDQINTSMARLSMLIDKAEESPQKEVIFSSPSFKQDFAELLREVDELSDNLRLYNQQLTEAQQGN